MAFLRWIIGFAFTVVITAFAVINRQPIDIYFNPLDETQLISLPVYAVMLGSLALGFVFGAFIVWLNDGKIRRERRKARKEIKILEKTVSELNENRFVVPPTREVKETKAPALASRF
ncbi:MAG: lipopolysaccharide assembly protein LapA domain-containing protein [Alphaproteobacteria bacterium]|nr:lipopolysaccharide assembly protein LapA domain-containing protein [Alphaproteobacteria bacterium]